MISIRNDMVVTFDVDDTLFFWNSTPEQLEKDGIPVKWVDSLGYLQETLLVPHSVHVQQLKKHKERGHLILVWSAGGSLWAEAAVKALGLEKYVDYTLCKSHWAYDDLPPEEYMPKSKWMKDGDRTLKD